MEDWDSKTYRYNTGCGWLYVTIDTLQGKPIHCFLQQNGGCSAMANAMGRLISDWLEEDMPIEKIQKSLSKITCPNCVESPDSDGKSCPWLIAKTFDVFKEKEEVKVLKSPF